MLSQLLTFKKRLVILSFPQKVEGKKNRDFQKLKLQKNGGNVGVELNTIPSGWKLMGHTKEVKSANFKYLIYDVETTDSSYKISLFTILCLNVTLEMG